MSARHKATPHGDDDIPTRATLIHRLSSGNDEEAWEQFYQIYQGVIMGMARRWGLGETAGCDVMQDVMLSVSKVAGGFSYDKEQRVFLAKAQEDSAKARGGFRQWLFTVVKRAIWKQRYDSRHRREISFCDMSEEGDWAGNIPAAGPTPDEALNEKSENDYALALLEQAIRFLPACTRRSHPRKVAIFLALKQPHVFDNILKSPEPPLPAGHVNEIRTLGKLPKDADGLISKQSIMNHYSISSNHLDQEVKAIKDKLKEIFSDLRNGRDPRGK